MAGTSPAMTRSWTTVAAGLKPGRNGPQSSEPAGVGHASPVGLRKIPLRLEAVEVGVECRIERGPHGGVNRVQERILGDRPVARIYDGGADRPDRSSGGAAPVQVGL